MRLCVASRIGTGTGFDSIRPDLPANVETWAALELPNGDFLVAATDVLTAITGTLDLGDQVTTILRGGQAQALANRLGITRAEVENLTIGEALFLYVQNHDARGGLRPADTANGKRWQIALNGVLVYDAPVVEGGATDAFTYSNGVLQTVSSGAWVKHNPGSGNGDFTVASNALTTAFGADTAARHATNISDANHWAQADIIRTGTPGTGNFTGAGPVSRMDTDTTDLSGFVGYWGQDGGADSFIIFRYTDGSRVSIASTTTGAAGAGTKACRIQSTGSLHTMYAAGAQVLQTTDTAHATNTYAGLFSREWGGVEVGADNFESGVGLALVEAPTIVHVNQGAGGATITGTITSRTYGEGETIVIETQTNYGGTADGASLLTPSNAGGALSWTPIGSQVSYGESSGSGHSHAWWARVPAGGVTSAITCQADPLGTGTCNIDIVMRRWIGAHATAPIGNIDSFNTASGAQNDPLTTDAGELTINASAGSVVCAFGGDWDVVGTPTLAFSQSVARTEDRNFVETGQYRHCSFRTTFPLASDVTDLRAGFDASGGDGAWACKMYEVKAAAGGGSATGTHATTLADVAVAFAGTVTRTGTHTTTLTDVAAAFAGTITHTGTHATTLAGVTAAWSGSVGSSAPSAVQNLTATPGDEQVTLDWDPPASDGGSTITAYPVEWRVKVT